MKKNILYYGAAVVSAGVLAGAVALVGVVNAQVSSSTGSGTATTPSVNMASPGTTTNTTTPSIAPANSAVSLTLNVYSGGSGAAVKASGAGFKADEPITINFGGTTWTATADSNGNFTLPLTVPAGSMGSVTITAVGDRSGGTAQNVFFVTAGGNTTTSASSTTSSSTATSTASTTPSIPALLPFSTGASGTATSTVAWPPIQQIRPAVVDISADGTVLIRGTVEHMGTSSLSVRSWGGVWTIQSDTTTLTAPTAQGALINNLSGFSVGDYVGILGRVASSTASSTDWTVHASYIRDWTSTVQSIGL